MSDTPGEFVIEYEHVNIYRSNRLLLSDVSIQVQPGEFIYLIGKTGTGKSSFIKSLYAEVPVREGKAVVCGYDLTSLKQKDIPYLRRKLGIVYQDFRLLGDRNTHENLAFVLRATGWVNGREMDERIDEVLNEVGMSGIGKKMPHQLSGGEQQRLVIARSLLNNPALLIADEPTGNLDPETSDEIMRLLIRINREHNTAILMATHNYLVIDKYPARIYNCAGGTISHEKGIYMKF